MIRPAATISCVLLLTACGACEDDRVVRFGLDPNPSTTTTGETPPPDPQPGDVSGHSLPTGTTTAEVDGVTLTIPQGSIRAAVASDLDGDDDADAIVILETPEQGTSLAVARRNDDGFAPLATIASWARPAIECTLANARLDVLGSAFIAAFLDLDCPDGRHVELRAYSHEAAPRPAETLRVTPLADSPATLTARALDADDDQRHDLAIDLNFGSTRVPEPVHVELVWLDRPNGLALRDDQPEATLTAIGQQARAAVRGDANAALGNADRALLLYDAMCRESGRARVHVGEAGAAGLTCRASAGAGSAAFVRTIALARGNDLAGALEALARLDDPGLRVTARDRREAAERLTASVGLAGQVLPGITLPPRLDTVRVSRLAFETPNILLVRSEPPQRIDLEAWSLAFNAVDSTIPPLPVLPDAISPDETKLLVTDPTGRFAVASVGRNCEGYALSIVRTEQIVGATVIGAEVSHPLIERAPPLATCPAITPAARQDDGDFVVLGWAPQGVVVARREALFVVPLTVDGAPAGESTRLPPGTLPPAPLRPGAISGDGSLYAFMTPAGVVLRHSDGRIDLTQLEGDVTDLAVAPDGSSIAYVQEGAVHVETLVSVESED